MTNENEVLATKFELINHPQEKGEGGHVKYEEKVMINLIIMHKCMPTWLKNEAKKKK